LGASELRPVRGDPPLRRLGWFAGGERNRGGLASNLFGVAGLVALVVGTFILVRRTIGSHGIDTTLTEKLFLLIWPLFIIRFGAQADKLEYILPLIPLSLLVLSAPRQPRLVAAIVALSLVANSLLSISLFQRPIASDQLQFAPRLNKGALFHDWAQRRVIQNALDPDFLNRLSAIVYPAMAATLLHHFAGKISTLV
jgi:hypothetical protein